MTGLADWLVVLEPGVRGGRDALLVPTVQLYRRARHGRGGDFACGGLRGHWVTK